MCMKEAGETVCAYHHTQVMADLPSHTLGKYIPMLACLQPFLIFPGCEREEALLADAQSMEYCKSSWKMENICILPKDKARKY